MSMRADARVMASTAPRNAREPGSPEWCYQTMNLMKHSFQSIQSDHQRFENYLDELREHRAWEKVPIDAPYGSEERMLEVEIGKHIEQIQEDLAAAKRVQKAALVTTGKVMSEGRPKLGNLPSFSQRERASQNGVSPRTQRRLDAIARQRPDLLEEVRAGRLSANRAALEAGIDREPSAFERLQRAIERFGSELTPEERQQLKDML